MPLYRSLSREKSEVRLVRFVQDADVNAPIHLELRHASLKDSDIQYSALSYVWGSPEDSCEIFIHGTALRIRHNLHDALCQLRSIGVSSWLWIDSICIRQSDVDEKTWQVGLMHPVFSQAQRVYIWLGPGTEATNRSMDFMSRMGPQALSAGSLDYILFPRECSELKELLEEQESPPNESIKSLSGYPDIKRARLIATLYEEDGLHSKHGYLNLAKPNDLLEGITDIMRREYWHRIWIIQEVSLCPAATVMCGTRSVPIGEFDTVLMAIDFTMRIKPRNISRDKITFASSLSGYFFVSTALFSRRLYQRQSSTGDTETGNRRDLRLGHILNQTATLDRPHYSATDPRDIVFGVLGIIPEENHMGLVIDYTLTVNQVFCQLTKALYLYSGKKGERAFHLDSCVPRKHPHAEGLPSWVPDWVLIGRYGLQIYPIQYGWNMFHAADAGWMMSKASALQDTSHDLTRLCHRGYMVDTITKVLDPPRWKQFSEWHPIYVENGPEWVQSVVGFNQLGPESGPAEDYIWRTMTLGDAFFFGPQQRLMKRTQHGNLTLFNNEDADWVVRRILRQEHISPESLTPRRREFINNDTYDYVVEFPHIQTTVDRLAFMRDIMFRDLPRGRTMFKTAKSMLGMGHEVIEKGDVVTLIPGIASPIILRPRGEGGFTFVGDAYVDGIMRGEFLKTEPVLRDFDIY